jgi:hypothetical protein
MFVLFHFSASEQHSKGWIQGDRAEASARLKTELLGWHSLKFALSRKDGIWSISDLHSLEADEVHSWFGDEEAERRRRMDKSHYGQRDRERSYRRGQYHLDDVRAEM